MNAERLLAHYERIADAPDAISRLRRFVLDLSVRGKLVPQVHNDEPASELLKRIAKERKRLSLRDANSPLIGDEAPFELPSGWSWTSLGDICSKTGSGSTPRGGKDVYKQSGVPFLRSQNIHNDRLRLDDVAFISPQVHEQMKGTRVLPGDLLLNITGGSMGRCGRVPEDFGEANVSQHVAIIRPAVRGMDTFLHGLILSPYFQAFIFDEQTGAGRGGLPKNRMDKIAFALPPLAEQLRIVAKVDELMGLCDRLEAARAGREAVRDRLTAASLARLNAPDPETFQADACFVLDALPALTTRPDQIKALRRTILNLAVRGKLVAQDLSDEPASELLKRIAAEKERLVRAGILKVERGEKAQSSPQAPFELPPGWTWARLQSLCLTISDGDHQAPPRSATGVPFLVIGDVKTKVINYDAERKVEQGYFDGLDPVRKPRPGDILYTLVGSFGIPAPVLTDKPFCVQRHIGILRPAKDVDQLALVLFLESELAFKQADQAATGIAQKTVSLAGLRSMLIPVPPLAEQRRILVRVKGLMTLCDKLEAAIGRADSERTRLLEALLKEALDPSQLAEAA